MWEQLTPEQRNWFGAEVRQLLRESDGFEDAKAYAGDILTDAVEKWPELEASWESMRDMVYTKLKELA